MAIKLSIIVPVYNVEEYIHPCVESIFKQGLDESTYEVILVNDGTKDNSFGVIEDIVNSHSNILIVEQKNQGLSAARNTGMTKASGDYILFLDSDDLLIENTLGKLTAELNSSSPDILYAGFVKMTNEEIDTRKMVAQEECICRETTGRKGFLEDYNARECYSWRAFYKRTFLEEKHLRFIPGIYFEDVPFTTECHLVAGKCIRTDYTFYIYRQRPGSIVSAINKKKVMDFNYVIARLWELRRKKLTPPEDKQLIEAIFITFSLEMWYIAHTPELYADRKEIIADLKEKVPNLSFRGSMKRWIKSFLFKHAPTLCVKLHAL
jgi:glycosyltransferase involved in cell wall biosynthesis